MGTTLPCQRQFPGLDSALDIIIPRGPKSDVLSPLVIRKELLYPFVKLPGKRIQVLGGVECGTPQLL